MTTPTLEQNSQSLLFLFIHQITKEYYPTEPKVIFNSKGHVNPIFPPKYINNDIIKNCIPQTDIQINRNTKEQAALFYLKNAIYSALVPDLRFFKVKYGLKDGFPDPDKKKVIECPFPRSLRNNIIDDKGTLLYDDPDKHKVFARPVAERAGQIGIKSFNWNYVGTDSYTALRDIEAELTLTMDGIGALSALRKNEEGQKYRLMDLLIQSDCFKEQTAGTQAPNSSAPLKYDPGCYELLVEAGYFIDDATLKKMIKKMGIANTAYSPVDFSDADVEKAIKNFSVEKLRSTMYLTVVDHKFTFGENGKVECTINYRARSAVTEKYSNLNIYYSAEENRVLKIITRKLEAAEEVLRQLNIAGTYTKAPAGVLKAKRDYNKLPRNVYFANTAVGLVRYPVATLAQAETAVEEYKKLRDERIKEIKGASGKSTGTFGEDIVKILVARDQLYLFQRKSVRPELTRYNEQPSVSRLKALQAKYKTKPPPSPTAGPSVPPTSYPKGKPIPAPTTSATKTKSTTPAYTVVKTSEASLDNENADVFYFLGDLLDAVLFRTRGTIPGSSPAKIRSQVYEDYRFVLGNVKLADPGTAVNFYRLVPLASFPISHKLFMKMVEDLNSQKSPRMSFTGFVDKLLKQIEKIFTIETTKVAFSDKKLLFRTLTFNHYAKKGRAASLPFQDITYTPYQEDGVNVDLVNMSPHIISALYPRPFAKTKNYMLPVLPRVISTLDRSIINNFRVYHIVCFTEESAYNFAARQYGDIAEDFKNNVPHFSHGQGYGLIKKVTLEKSDIPFAKEQRFEQANKNNELAGKSDFYLTNFYNATFEMIGNDLCTLGGYIYFDPFGLAPNGSLGNPNQVDPPSLSYIMGLGGVHIITKISHKMTPGKYTTTVKTRWENRGALKSS